MLSSKQTQALHPIDAYMRCQRLSVATLLAHITWCPGELSTAIFIAPAGCCPNAPELLPGAGRLPARGVGAQR
jgi:hypothetical protein